MARNGSGTFSNPYPNFVSGTVISSTQVDANNSDIATALTQSIAVDGQSTVTANLPMNAKKLTGLAVGAAATDSLNLGQAQAEAMVWCGTAGGSANAITLSPTPAITAYAAGQRFVWKASGSVNTGATTVAISGLGAIALQDNGAAFVAGNHAANKIFMGILDTASTVQVMQVQISGTDPLLVSSLTVSGTATVGGILSVDDTTTSTSGTTGSIHTDGGLGVAGTAFVAGAAKIVGVTTHGDDVVSDTDSTDDLGTTGVRWKELFVDAITATDQVTATGFTGTLDGILGSGTPALATVTTIEPTGDTSAGDNAAMGYTSVLGAILTGQGSTNDVTLVNDADATVLGIPTGTTNVAIIGDLTANNFAGRNRIINGAMVIDQRNAGASISVTPTVFTADRWAVQAATGGAAQQITSTIAGFANSLKYTSSASNAFLQMGQQIEYLNCYDLQNVTVSISFWAKANNTNGGSTALVVRTRTIAAINGAARFSSSAVDTSVTITTSAVKYTVTRTLPATFGALSLEFVLGAHVSGDGFEITGVQLEKSSTATEFDYRSVGTELALCQRYFTSSFPGDVGASTSSGRIYVALGLNADTINKGGFIKYSQTMRAAPTFTFYNESGGTGSFTGPAAAGNVLLGTQYGVNVYVSTSSRDIFLHYAASAEL
jgi:hypothetical protein